MTGAKDCLKMFEVQLQFLGNYIRGDVRVCVCHAFEINVWEFVEKLDI